MADVTLSYKGSTIAELSASGSKTIETAGMFCEADIDLAYVKPSGGGVTAATGTVTLLSEVANPGATESLTFPGIQLDFQPDFIFVCLDNASTSAIKSTASGGHLYWCVCAKKEILPIFRISSSITTDNFDPSIPIRAFGGSSFTNSTDAPNGYGTPAGGVCTAENRIANWGLNADGTFSYGQFVASAGTALNPGTYRYFAFKVT